MSCDLNMMSTSASTSASTAKPSVSATEGKTRKKQTTAATANQVITEQDVEQIKLKIKKAVPEHIEMWVSSNERNDDIRRHLTGVAKFLALKAGDIWFMVNSKLLFIWERKSIGDLSASIGKRSKEQKFKLKRMPIHLTQIAYVIEGDKYTKFMKPPSTLIGAQVNILVRDQMHLLHTKTSLETVFWALKMLVKVAEYEYVWKQTLDHLPVITHQFDPLAECKVKVSSTSTSSSSSTSNSSGGHKTGSGSKVDQHHENAFAEAYSYTTEKRSVQTPRSYYLRMLQCIAGIRQGKAEALADEFPTLVELVGYLIHPEIAYAKKIERIGNLRFKAVQQSKKKSSATNKRKAPADGRRRIGDQMAHKLYAFLTADLVHLPTASVQDS